MGVSAHTWAVVGLAVLSPAWVVGYAFYLRMAWKAGCDAQAAGDEAPPA